MRSDALWGASLAKRATLQPGSAMTPSRSTRRSPQRCTVPATSTSGASERGPKPEPSTDLLAAAPESRTTCRARVGVPLWPILGRDTTDSGRAPRPRQVRCRAPHGAIRAVKGDGCRRGSEPLTAPRHPTLPLGMATAGFPLLYDDPVFRHDVPAQHHSAGAISARPASTPVSASPERTARQKAPVGLRHTTT